MTLPNFLIVGAPKCGTTSIASALGSHPEIHIADVKEVSFFNSNHMWAKGLTDYSTYFDTELVIIGEATPFYGSSLEALERINVSLAHVKLIYVIRNPIDRAHSHYSFRARAGTESRPLSVVIEEELASPDAKTNYLVKEGDYAHHLSNMLRIFGTERVMVIVYEELVGNATTELEKLSSYLQVTQPAELSLARMNSASAPRNAVVAFIIKYMLTKDSLLKNVLLKLIGRKKAITMFGSFKSIFSKKQDKIAISEKDRNTLFEIYDCSVVELRSMLGKDVFAWQSFSPNTDLDNTK